MTDQQFYTVSLSLIGVLGSIIGFLLVWILKDFKSTFKDHNERIEQNESESYKNRSDIDKLYLIVKSNEKRDHERMQVMEKMLDAIAVTKLR